MRVKPSAAIVIALVIVYMVIVGLLWSSYDFEYDKVADSVTTVKEGVVYPVAAGALFLAIAATVLGWWGPVLREELRLTSKLAKFLPIALLLGAAVNLVATEWDNVESDFVVWLLIGVALIGFSEEMLFRGLGLVGARGSFNETRAMVFTAVLFGLLHGLNAFFGQSVAGTIQQIVFAAVFGVVYYALRRATGTIVVPMVVHALWDGSLFVNDHSGADPSPLANLFMFAAILLTILSLRHESKANKVLVTAA